MGANVLKIQVTTQSVIMTNITLFDSVRFSVYLYSETSPSQGHPTNFHVSKLREHTSTSHATVFNLQPCEFCKEARLSTKFAHTGRRIICNKKDFVRWPRHIQLAAVKVKSMPAKNSAQYNN